ncbi:hypothetical protein H4R34_001249 [Dimargaris verticillata]|uniref:Uncharacterized protein n=1 Tax=Dimargaris verticillata TaxID=2761393 RepID=A0A9W8B5U0_9FUNG|nr:hypothetical protein H4R34_001249 [Dimargaris verticillata]
MTEPTTNTAPNTVVDTALPTSPEQRALPVPLVRRMMSTPFDPSTMYANPSIAPHMSTPFNPSTMYANPNIAPHMSTPFNPSTIYANPSIVPQMSAPVNPSIAHVYPGITPQQTYGWAVREFKRRVSQSFNIDGTAGILALVVTIYNQSGREKIGLVGMVVPEVVEWQKAASHLQLTGQDKQALAFVVQQGQLLIQNLQLRNFETYFEVHFLRHVVDYLYSLDALLYLERQTKICEKVRQIRSGLGYTISRRLTFYNFLNGLEGVYAKTSFSQAESLLFRLLREPAEACYGQIRDWLKHDKQKAPQRAPHAYSASVFHM